MTQETKQTLVGALFAIACVLLYFFYPVNDSRFEIFAATMIFLLGLPLLFNRIILKRDWKNFMLTTWSCKLDEIFLLFGGVVCGGLLSFLLVSVDFGVQPYVDSLSYTIMKSFKAFAIYELGFVSLALLLFSIFTWGFVRSLQWYREIYAYIFSLMIFLIILTDFYSSFFMAIPVILPAVLLIKINRRVNPIYIFIACYAISLILDVIIVKSSSTL